MMFLFFRNVTNLLAAGLLKFRKIRNFLPCIGPLNEASCHFQQLTQGLGGGLTSIWKLFGGCLLSTGCTTICVHPVETLCNQIVMAYKQTDFIPFPSDSEQVLGDLEAAYDQWHQSRQVLAELPMSMFWQEKGGIEYLGATLGHRLERKESLLLCACRSMFSQSGFSGFQNVASGHFLKILKFVGFRPTLLWIRANAQLGKVALLPGLRYAKSTSTEMLNQ